MQTTTPQKPHAPVKTEQRDCQIGVAVITDPVAAWNFKGFALLSEALLAGLRRDSISIVEEVGHFRPIYSVNLITVPQKVRAEAIESIKRTLTELALLQFAQIAVLTAENAHLVIYDGLPEAGGGFDELWLDRNEVAAARAEFEQLKKSRETILAFLKKLRDLTRQQPPS